ncbi:cyclic nucleotide-binding domain-containing protein [Reinekea blandensis]|uniref:Cyclic nucleotide-binding domain-containing protein n=1 Tax=Reinekea blandensis MED297 TaxID=314283 RepID=A4BEG8_9GAMM|nr:cyclic nucleotide-binding domain-containing protein [Reinekea blandensis]EAR09395.1 hypothetical protein MED297_02207 [Reinekea sp. MED297] [Reinekea blandensis MED297]
MKRTHQLPSSRLLTLMDQIPFFNRITLDEREQIIRSAQIFVADPGEPVIEKGAKDTCFYVLLSGSVRVELEPGGRLLAELTPGDIFGEIGFVLNTPRTSYVTASRMCALLRVDQTLLNRLAVSAREKIKDQIILKLATTIERLNEDS